MPGQHSQQVVRCGWLESSTTLNGPTKQSWWVLTAADSLTCFVSDSSASNSLECQIPLSDVLAVSAGLNPREFQIKTVTNTMAFVAESQASAESWRGAIDEARRAAVSLEEPRIASNSIELVVDKVKTVLVELDLVLQALVGMICGEDLLREQYGVQLNIHMNQRLELLEQLGMDASKGCGVTKDTRAQQVHLHVTTMLTQAEAEHRNVLQENPIGLSAITLSQIGENTQRLASLSVMLKALNKHFESDFSSDFTSQNTGGGFAGLRIESSLHNNGNLEHEVSSLQNVNLDLNNEVSKLKQSKHLLSEQLDNSKRELERWNGEAMEIERIQLENDQVKRELSGSKGELADMQAAYTKLRDYTSNLQQRYNQIESVFTAIEDFLDDNVLAASDQDIALDSKLAALTEDCSVPLDAWQRVLHFKLIPALKVVKHSSYPESTNSSMQAEIHRLEAQNKQLVAELMKESESSRGLEASALREQLAASENQISELTTQLLEVSKASERVPHKHVAALESRNRELEAELGRLDDLSVLEKQAEALEAKKCNLEREIAQLESRKQGNPSLELAQVEARSQDQQRKIEELYHVISRFEQHHAVTLAEFEREMAAGFALNQTLQTKYEQLQTKANDTMHKLKHLKAHLQNKEEHRESILRDAQTSFNELKQKYVKLETAHQERKKILEANEYNRMELNKMVERIRELEELQSGKEKVMVERSRLQTSSSANNAHVVHDTLDC